MDAAATLAEELFTCPAWLPPEGVRQLKSELNCVKSLLNDKDISEWGAHTSFTNTTGDVVLMIRETIEAELCTTAWCKLMEVLRAFPAVVSPSAAASNSASGSSMEQSDVDHGSPVAAATTAASLSEAIGVARTSAAAPFSPPPPPQSLVSIHLCEAPGAFVTALNHHLHDAACLAREHTAQASLSHERLGLGTTASASSDSNDTSRPDAATGAGASTSRAPFLSPVEAEPCTAAAAADAAQGVRPGSSTTSEFRTDGQPAGDTTGAERTGSAPSVTGHGGDNITLLRGTALLSPTSVENHNDQYQYWSQGEGRLIGTATGTGSSGPRGNKRRRTDGASESAAEAGAGVVVAVDEASLGLAGLPLSFGSTSMHRYQHDSGMVTTGRRGADDDVGDADANEHGDDDGGITKGAGEEQTAGAGDAEGARSGAGRGKRYLCNALLQQPRQHQTLSGEHQRQGQGKKQEETPCRCTESFSWTWAANTLNPSHPDNVNRWVNTIARR